MKFHQEEKKNRMKKIEEKSMMGWGWGGVGSNINKILHTGH